MSGQLANNVIIMFFNEISKATIIGAIALEEIQTQCVGKLDGRALTQREKALEVHLVQ